MRRNLLKSNNEMLHSLYLLNKDRFNLIDKMVMDLFNGGSEKINPYGVISHNQLANAAMIKAIFESTLDDDQLIANEAGLKEIIKNRMDVLGQKDEKTGYYSFDKNKLQRIGEITQGRYTSNKLTIEEAMPILEMDIAQAVMRGRDADFLKSDGTGYEKRSYYDDQHFPKEDGKKIDYAIVVRAAKIFNDNSVVPNETGSDLKKALSFYFKKAIVKIIKTAGNNLEDEQLESIITLSLYKLINQGMFEITGRWRGNPKFVVSKSAAEKRYGQDDNPTQGDLQQTNHYYLAELADEFVDSTIKIAQEHLEDKNVDLFKTLEDQEPITAFEEPQISKEKPQNIKEFLQRFSGLDVGRVSNDGVQLNVGRSTIATDQYGIGLISVEDISTLSNYEVTLFKVTVVKGGYQLEENITYQQLQEYFSGDKSKVDNIYLNGFITNDKEVNLNKDVVLGDLDVNNVYTSNYSSGAEEVVKGLEESQRNRDKRDLKQYKKEQKEYEKAQRKSPGSRIKALFFSAFRQGINEDKALKE